MFICITHFFFPTLTPSTGLLFSVSPPIPCHTLSYLTLPCVVFPYPTLPRLLDPTTRRVQLPKSGSASSSSAFSSKTDDKIIEANVAGKNRKNCYTSFLHYRLLIFFIGLLSFAPSPTTGFIVIHNLILFFFPFYNLFFLPTHNSRLFVVFHCKS